MASEREDAKSGIVERESEDPDLTGVLSGAQKYQLELVREQNQHDHKMKTTDVGFFGRIAGGTNASTFTAFATASISLIAAIILWKDQPDAGKALLGFAGTAIGFIFGRSTK